MASARHRRGKTGGFPVKLLQAENQSLMLKGPKARNKNSTQCLIKESSSSKNFSWGSNDTCSISSPFVQHYSNRRPEH